MKLTPAQESEAENLRRAQLADFIGRWDPSDRPLHCSNCLHCRVQGSPVEPVAHCRKGHDRRGQSVPLARLLRPKAPFSFVAMGSCLDFEESE
ncbi:MAG: hypothetical protein NUW01_14335 [Gemmatimonadaceae bacterium]|nr:hypothetical protein [Gemmatimonadaceae bacterium]